MIIWTNFNNLEEIVDKITKESKEITPKSFEILVYCRFSMDKTFEVKKATIKMYGFNDYTIIVHGMMGNIEITHYSMINTPEDGQVSS